MPAQVKYRPDPILCRLRSSTGPPLSYAGSGQVPARPYPMPAQVKYRPDPILCRIRSSTGPTLSYAGSDLTLMARPDFLQYPAYYRPIWKCHKKRKCKICKISQSILEPSNSSIQFLPITTAFKISSLM